MSYTWNLPTRVLFGAGVLRELGKQALPGKKALLVTSCGGSVRRNGSLEATQKGLAAAGASHVLFDQIEQNPQEPTLMEGVSLARACGCDFVVGLGGGSALDAAKAIAAVVAQRHGRIWDYMQSGTGGRLPLTETPFPCIAITTSAGTGSEVDCRSVITNPATCEKITLRGAYPTLAIVDPELMRTVPPDFTAYQGFDALFHCVEGYLSRRCNEAAEMVELTAIRLIARYLPAAVRNGDDMEARTKLAFANTLGGYSMELSSCISQHAMEHALSGHHPALPHGAGLLMLSIAYFSRMIEGHVCDERFVALARALGHEAAACAGDFLTALQALMTACSVDGLRMRDYGIVPQELPRLAKEARSVMEPLFLCDRAALSEADVTEIYRAAYR